MLETADAGSVDEETDGKELAEVHHPASLEVVMLESADSGSVDEETVVLNVEVSQPGKIALTGEVVSIDNKDSGVLYVVGRSKNFVAVSTDGTMGNVDIARTDVMASA